MTTKQRTSDGDGGTPQTLLPLIDLHVLMQAAMEGELPSSLPKLVIAENARGNPYTVAFASRFWMPLIVEMWQIAAMSCVQEACGRILHPARACTPGL